LVTPDQFAEVICEDLRLPMSGFLPMIASSIKEQLQDYFLNASSMVATPKNDDQRKRKYDELKQSLSDKENLDIPSTPTVDQEEQDEKLQSEELAHVKLEDEKKPSTKQLELRTLIKVTRRYMIARVDQ
jgi:hypothetical protein